MHIPGQFCAATENRDMFQNFETTADKAATTERLSAMRKNLAQMGLTGFIVPRADAHQGEYVAPHDE